MLAHARQHRCDWSGLDELFAAINRQLENGEATHRHPANPFPVLAMPTSPRAQLHAAQRWARGFAPAPPLPRPAVTVGDGERLRIGFVSSDLREHPMAHLQVEHWERIDRGRFETCAYSLRPREESAIGERAAAAFDRYADVSGDTLTSIARRIRNDRIAILFDLNGYTTHSREHLFALRPAPIQINSIGFPGTLGATGTTTSWSTASPQRRRCKPYYTERLWPMPNSFYRATPARTARNSAIARRMRLAPEGFVFAASTRPTRSCRTCSRLDATAGCGAG